jgi:GTP cyclohydrolase I
MDVTAHGDQQGDYDFAIIPVDKPPSKPAGTALPPLETSANWSGTTVSFGGAAAREAMTHVTAEELAAELLRRVWPNWDPNDPHSKDTPKRLAQSLAEMCNRGPAEFNFTTFPAEDDEMIVLEGIPFYTLCQHHVVPFHGTVHIGYIPNKKVAGLSKFARAVRYCAKGLWVQEQLTTAIHNYIHNRLDPSGLAIVIRAEHMCMSMRGVQTPGVTTTTAKMSGLFADHTRTAKAEFLQWIGSKNT